MTTSTLLAAGTTAVTSSDFTVAAGQPVRVAMTATSTNARMTVHSVVLGVESLYATLSQSDPGITISAPGTYRVKRPVLTVASGVEVSTLVENHAELEVGAASGNTVGIADPVGGVIKIVSATTNPLTGGVSFSAGGALANGDLIQCGVPLVLPSSGSIGNNGALTLTTALPYAYPAAFMYFPASAIVSGSAAGWYYVAMSTTLLGTIYNDVYVSGKPVVPSSPVTFSTTGPGAYTQTTGGAITSLNFTVPGGALGKSGALTITKMGACTNSANSKIVETFLGGSNFASYTFTTSNVYRALDTIANICNSEAINIGNFYANIGGNGADWKRQVVNTAADQTLALTMRINTATDFIVLESAAVGLVHGN